MPVDADRFDDMSAIKDSTDHSLIDNDGDYNNNNNDDREDEDDLLGDLDVSRHSQKSNALGKNALKFNTRKNSFIPASFAGDVDIFDDSGLDYDDPDAKLKINLDNLVDDADKDLLTEAEVARLREIMSKYAHDPSKQPRLAQLTRKHLMKKKSQAHFLTAIVSPPKNIMDTQRSGYSTFRNLWGKEKKTGILVSQEEREIQEAFGQKRKKKRVRFLLDSEKREFHLPMFHPSGHFIKFINQAEIAVHICSTMRWPVSIAFHDEYWMLDAALDAFYMFHLIVFWNTGYLEDDPEHPGMQRIGWNRTKITRNIMRTDDIFQRQHGPSFFNVAILQIALFYVVRIFLFKYEVLYFFSSIFRLDRINLLSSYFRKMELDLHVNVKSVASLKFLVLLIGCPLWLGSFWWWTARVIHGFHRTWVEQYITQFPDQLDGMSHPVDDMPLWMGVEITLYWGFMSLTNVGYSDILPDRSIELILVIFIAYMQIAFYAYILGTIFNYMVKKDEKLENYRKLMINLDNYAGSRNLPTDLLNRLKHHFDFQHSKNASNDREIMMQMPTALITKIADFQYKALVELCVIFNGCQEQFIGMLLVKLRPKYLQPRETLFKKNDMSRELCFVESGDMEVYALDQTTPAKIIRKDSSEGGTLGELAFFMGIQQPYKVQASMKGDATLLSLNRENYEAILEFYPDGHDIIVTNILTSFGLDKNGKDLSSSFGGGKNEDEAFDELKKTIQAALQKRTEDELAAMIDAASSGDVDEVRRMLHKGLDVNAGDYDDRTTLHLAAVEGNLKVVECLVSEGADVHFEDRWGRTALHDAIDNKHFELAEYLSNHGAELVYEDSAGVLCDAAANGDMDMLRRLVDHGISPDSSDYDGRSALHLAAVDGNTKVTEYLLGAKANVNIKDRWDNTPIMDAIEQGNELCAVILSKAGGELNLGNASVALCSAASDGDENLLRILHEAGANIMEGDYDDRTALHLASAEGQIVSVDFLLSAKADVDFMDRWQGVPVDDAISGKHWEVTKLLLAFGGTPSKPLTPKQMGILETLSIRNIRMKIREQVQEQRRRRHIKDELKDFIKGVPDHTTVALEKLAAAREKLSIQAEKARIRVSVNRDDEDETFDVDEDLQPTGGENGGEDDLLGQLNKDHDIEDDHDSSSFMVNRFFTNKPGGSNTETKISNLNQLMLLIPKITDGLQELKTYWNELVDDYTDMISPASFIKLCMEDLDLEIENVQEFIAITLKETVARLYEPDFVDQPVMTFRSLLKAQTFWNIVLDDADKNANKKTQNIAKAISIMRASFDLLDLQGTGKVNASEWNKGVNKKRLGDFAKHDDMAYIFGGMSIITREDFYINLCRWADVLENEHEDYFDDEDMDGINFTDLKDLEQLKKFLKFKNKSRLKRFLKSMWRSLKGITIEDMILDKLEVGKDFSRNMEEAFAQVDTDESGFIDRNEFDDLIKKIDVKLKTEDTDELFISFGADDHGQISLESFKRECERIHEEGKKKLLRNALKLKKTKKNKKADDDDDEGHSSVNYYRSKWVINVHSRWLFWWRRFFLFASLYNFLAVPFNISFIGMDLLTTQRSSLYVCYIMDSVLLIDIVIRFFTSYVNKKSVMIWDLGKIRRRYMKTRFYSDVIALLPVDLLTTIAGGNGLCMAWLRFPRLIHTREIVRYFKAKQATLENNRILSELQWLLFIMTGISHFLACIWFYMSTRQLDQNSLLNCDYIGYGAFAENVNGFDTTNEYAIPQYVLALYWVTTTLTTIGTGDMLAVTTLERLFVIILMIINLSVYAYMLGSISSLFMSADEQLVGLRQEISSVERYIREKNLPADITKEIRQIFEYKTSNSATVSNEDEGEIYKSLSHTLQVEVAHNICRGLVGELKVFQGCDEYFLDTLSTMLSEQSLSPGYFCFRKGEIARNLFIVAGGSIELVMMSGEEEFVEQILGEGDVAGEIPFFFNIRQMYSARVMQGQFVRAFILAKDDYRTLIKLYPQEEEVISHNALADVDMNNNNDGGAPGTARSGASDVNTDKVVDEGRAEDLNNVAIAIEKAREKKAIERICSMCFCAFKGHLEELKGLIENAEDIDAGDYDGRTPLHLAASEGHLDIVKFLHGKGADLLVRDRYDGTPMMDAVRHKRDNVTAYLRDQGCKFTVGDAAIRLCTAGSEGDVQALKRLIQNKVDTNAHDYDYRTAMHLAASNGHVEAVKFLIEQWADVNPVDRCLGTPLADAVRHGHKEVQTVLINNGGQMNAGGMDVAGQLCEAAATGDMDTLITLLDNGANVNDGDYDYRTALHLAASNNKISALDYLLSNVSGTDVNAVDRLGGTPLEDAIREGNKAIVTILQGKGGLRQGHPNLKERIITRDKKSKDGIQARKILQGEHNIRDIEHEKLLGYMRVVDEGITVEMTTVRGWLDVLSTCVNPAIAKQNKTIDRSPKPDLAESLRFFFDSLRSYMYTEHVHNHLDFFIAVEKFRKMDPTGGKLLAQTVNKMYLDPTSLHYILVDPVERDKIRDTIDKIEDYAFIPLDLFDNLTKFIIKLLEKKLTGFYESESYYASLKLPSGRIWRITTLCRLIHNKCTDLTSSVVKQCYRVTKSGHFSSVPSVTEDTPDTIQGEMEKVRSEIDDIQKITSEIAKGAKEQHIAQSRRKEAIEKKLQEVQKKKNL